MLKETKGNTVEMLDWHGEGWYTFMDGGIIAEEEAVWVENWSDFVDAVNSLALDFSGADFYGDHCFPDENVRVSPAFLSEAEWSAWQELRYLLDALRSDADVEMLLSSIDGYLNRGGDALAIADACDYDDAEAALTNLTHLGIL